MKLYQSKLMTRKIAFTLSEVLITLGIIGVVAAMTIPGLITDFQHKHTAAKLKKFYSTMLQVIVSAEEEFGPVGTWDKTTDYAGFAQTYLAPYMKFTMENDNETLDLLDGTTLYFKLGWCMDFIFDVNGKSKPNKYGYDKFYFVACNSSDSRYSSESYCAPNLSFCPYNENQFYHTDDRDWFVNRCKTKAQYCASLIKYDGWTFQDDYPYK